MFNHIGDEVAEHLGHRFHDLVEEHLYWSATTFGDSSERGPIGSLRHLQKEAQEAEEEPGDLEEYADCFLLILDATWRAGFNYQELLEAAEKKLEKCKKREWNIPDDPDEPWHHIEE